MDPDVELIKNLVDKHTRWRSSCLNMIASENLISPSVRNCLCSDLEHRYCNVFAPTLSSNWTDLSGFGSYQGLDFFQDIEKKCWDLLRILFNCKYADYRPLSGSISVMAIWLALTDPGDYIITRAPSHGGHGAGWDELAELIGRKYIHYEFDAENHTIDVEKSKRIIEKMKPKLFVFGSSHFLFPDPVKEFTDIATSYGAKIVYDGSHVMGLIAGKRFQDPLREGVDVLFGSSHKTFPGPQGGLIFSNADAKTVRKIDETLCYKIEDNYHPNRVAALAAASAEMLKFGETYAEQIIKNAKALAEGCKNAGLKPLAEGRGFTESHQVLIDVSPLGIDGISASHKLAEANIITSRSKLPKDESTRKASGFRLGTSELTRLGMKEGEMRDIANLIYMTLSGKEELQKVKEKVIQFIKNYQTLHYSFDEGKPAYTIPL